jgi:hypothetical protein
MAKNTQKIVKMIPLLEEIEFIGLMKILGVELLDEEGVERDFADLLEDGLRNFDALPRVSRRELFRIVKSATKGKTSKDMAYRKPKESNVEENVDSAPSTTTSTSNMTEEEKEAIDESED